MSIETERLTFKGANGEELAARLDRPPEGPMRGYALFAHCFTCSKDVMAASRISKALADDGFGTLRFDFTGLGHSDGEFANTNFSSNIGDLVAAADFLRRQYRAPSLLIGHSLGGAAVLAAAGEIDEVRGVATIGAPFEPEHVRHLFGGQIERISTEGEAEVTLAGRTFRITEQFLDDLTDHRMADKIRTLGRALLIFHSPVDDIVGIDNAARIYEAAKHPKSFVSLDDADHLLSEARDSEYVASVLAAWAGRYMGE